MNDTEIIILSVVSSIIATVGGFIIKSVFGGVDNILTEFVPYLLLGGFVGGGIYLVVNAVEYRKKNHKSPDYNSVLYNLKLGIGLFIIIIILMTVFSYIVLMNNKNNRNNI